MIYKRWWQFIVLRGDGIPAEMDGRWLDMDNVMPHYGIDAFEFGTVAKFEPTNKWEQRDDGQVAVVYEWVKV